MVCVECKDMKDTKSDSTMLDKFYEEICGLVEKGDEFIVKNDPSLITSYCKEKEFLAVLTPKPSVDTHTRRVLRGAPGKPVIVVMEWSAGYSTMPHEHHGRPCFEYVLNGEIVSTEFTETRAGNMWSLEKLNTTIVPEGSLAVLDPERTDIHRIYAPVRSITLNVYPTTKFKTFGYELDCETNLYSKKEFELTQD